MFETAFGSGLLSIAPKIKQKGQALYSRTNLLVWLLTLGLCWKTVVVDPRRKCVQKKVRILWFFPWTRRFPFKRIRKIDYEFKDWATSYTDTPSLTGRDAADALEAYSVGLRLKDGDRIHLWTFIGEGARIHPWWRDDQVLDGYGRQQEQSVGFVEALQKLTGKRLV